MAPERAPTSPAQRYYITPEGESPQPACKAKPITGRTLGAQGQRPGGAINPRPQGVNLREYWKAPPRSRSRSRPRRRRLNPQARQGLSIRAPFTQMAMKHKAPPRRKRRVTGFP